MLSRIFLQFAARSAEAGLVILLLLAVRPLLKKAPRAYCYALWGIVLLRLLCPLLPQSPLALLPQTDLTVKQAFTTANDTVSVAAPAPDVTVKGVLGAAQTDAATSVPPQAAVPAKSGTLLQTASAVWLAGALTVMGISLWQNRRLKKQLRSAVRLRDNLYRSAAVATPFTFGILRPRIYLPADFDGARQQYVLLHEQQHLRRFDYLTQPLGWLAVCLHWFNPLVWAAFRLAKRDMEISCDEAVIRQLGTDCRADYADTLLRLSVCRHPAGAAIGFGKGDSAERIRHLVRWKEPKRWICIAATALCVGLTVCLLTVRPAADAERTASDPASEAETQLTLAEHAADSLPEEDKSANEASAAKMPAEMPSEDPAETASEEGAATAASAVEAAEEAAESASVESGAAVYPNESDVSAPPAVTGTADGWLWPVPEYAYVSRAFAGVDVHNGIDIAAPYDTPIYAARGGTVIEAQVTGVGYGVYAIIDHGDGFSTMYSHCSSLAVEVGDTVEQGDLIGHVGNSGNSTGNHLHFEVRIDQVQVDPAPYIGQG